MNEKADKPKRQLYFYRATKMETSALSVKAAFQSNTMLLRHPRGAEAPANALKYATVLLQSAQNKGNLQPLCKC